MSNTNIPSSFLSREHNLRVIRPFVYVREKSIRQFAGVSTLPVIATTSVPELTKERQRAKQLLAQQEILFPRLFSSLRSSVQPLLDFKMAEIDVKHRRRLKSKENDEESDASVETDEECFLKTDWGTKTWSVSRTFFFKYCLQGTEKR